MTEYVEKLIDILIRADKLNTGNIDKASELIFNSIKNDGIIYMFGCGHSSLIASDCFYRAGGLANVQPVFVEKLMLHESASESSKLEKNEENAYGVLDEYKFGKYDVLFVFSVSGLNGVPVQIAIDGRLKNIKVIGIGSSMYDDEKSRHSSGKRLREVCDVFIDNCVPKGDAVMKYGDISAVPVSTAVTSCIIQTCIAKALEKCNNENIKPNVFGSGNLKENVDNNAQLVKKFKKNIRFL